MFEPELLAAIRDRFHFADECPYEGPRAFFENAGGSLTLKSVVARSTELLAVPDNQGRANRASQALGELIEQGRGDMRLFFGARAGVVMVGETGTELLGRLIRSAVLATTGDVVGSSLEHPATFSACRRWADVAGRSYHQVPFDTDTSLVGVDSYDEAITTDTSVATIIHASPVTGMHVDVAAIARRIREVAPDCFIIVDGIQHAAHGRIEVDSYDIDGYVVSGYKMFSRHNYGIAWISDRLAAVPHDQLDGTPPEAWEQGTRDASAYATFSEVVRYLEWLGAEANPELAGGSRDRIEAAADAIRGHEHGLVDALLRGTGGLPGLAKLDPVSVVGPVTSEHRAGMVSFEIAGIAAADVVEELRRDGVRTHVRRRDHYSAGILVPLGIDACVRASICHYNSRDEVERMLGSVNRMIAERL
ncbi:MAG: aminotransferase class V-fold PLP-dependent enzyme [Acidimicrobiia bacterium]|nr:aminotransferase class V-fold PLP-dependent enzyme [Acidimicrobiia bacterium]